MNNDLISRSALLEKAIGVVTYDEGGWDCNVRAVPDHVVENAPTIEAEPVRHGRWDAKIMKDIGTYTVYWCSECNCYSYFKFNYCPNCGCKMDGDDHAV